MVTRRIEFHAQDCALLVAEYVEALPPIYHQGLSVPDIKLGFRGLLIVPH
jgi:hypothetical protein